MLEGGEMNAMLGKYQEAHRLAIWHVGLYMGAVLTYYGGYDKGPVHIPTMRLIMDEITEPCAYFSTEYWMVPEDYRKGIRN